jgi:hypothetical protein
VTGMWRTPDAPGQSGGPRSRTNSRGEGHQVMTVAEQAEQWMTPTSRDWKDGADPSQTVPTNSLLSRQAPRTAMPGAESSETTQTSRRQLNPRFTEWLMGWKPGWSSLAPLDCASPETASYPSAPASPSAPSGDSLWTTPVGSDTGRKTRYQQGGTALSAQADNWPTPDTQNARGGAGHEE